MRLAVRGQRPDDLLRPEILRDAHCKYPPVAPGIEVRRLAAVGAERFRLDVVAGADRNIELFLPVPIDIGEIEVERAVRVLQPPVKDRGDALAVCIRQARIVSHSTQVLCGARCLGAHHCYHGRQQHDAGEPHVSDDRPHGFFLRPHTTAQALFIVPLPRVSMPAARNSPGSR